jgi:Polyketide cyclase / dehydrase and lipid transport
VQQLRPVDVDFFETATQRFVLTEPVHAPPERVFAAISADPSTWSWFEGVHDAGYGSAPPHGVGTARAIKMGDDIYRETIIAWDEPVRWAYRVDETTAPIFGALAEDWRIRADGDGSIVEWTFAFDPTAEGEAVLPVLPEMLAAVFRGAMQGLDAHLAQD